MTKIACGSMDRISNVEQKVWNSISFGRMYHLGVGFLNCAHPLYSLFEWKKYELELSVFFRKKPHLNSALYGILGMFYLYFFINYVQQKYLESKL